MRGILLNNSSGIEKLLIQSGGECEGENYAGDSVMSDIDVNYYYQYYEDEMLLLIDNPKFIGYDKAIFKYMSNRK